jgi:hypothetical protein
VKRVGVLTVAGDHTSDELRDRPVDLPAVKAAEVRVDSGPTCLWLGVAEESV